jgi:uncharacterized coiled-coil protein SlyX
MTGADLQKAIDNVRARLARLYAAVLALEDPTITSYRIDTGQSVQQVTREDLPMIEDRIAALESRLASLCSRQTGSGVTRGVPSW